MTVTRVVYSSGTITNATNAGTSYTPTTTPGAMFRISGDVVVTTGTTMAMTIVPTYRDAAGTVRSSDIFDLTTATGTTLAAGSIVAAGRYNFTKTFWTGTGGAQAISVTTAGTVTTCVYVFSYVIEEIQIP